MFWKRRHESEPEPVAGQPSELEPVRIYTADAVIEGWVNLRHQRLSDVLNIEELLSVAPNPHPLDRDWFVVEREDMLLAVPPPHTSDRSMRPHRVKRPILAQIGPYVIRGKAHLIAGIDLDRFLARSGQYFLPVTEAWVTNAVRSEVEEQHAALLLNVRTDLKVKLKVTE